FQGAVSLPGLISTPQALFRGESDAVMMLARAMMDAPGIPGATLSALTGDAVINDNGLVVFGARLSGDGIAAGARSLWMADASGELSLIVREGELFEVAPGDERLIIDVMWFDGLGGIDSGEGSALNHHNELVLGLRFEDGTSGVFITTIPAPGVVVPLAAVLALSGRRRCRV